MPQVFGKSQGDTLPAEAAAGLPVALLMDEFGAAITREEIRAACEQGTYYKACNPTLGTGIAMGIQTAFSDTANVLAILRNTSAAKKIIPHYIRLINTVAGATTTSSRAAVVLDTANRYSSGGADLTASIVNANSANGAASIADLRFGALTAAAVAAKRQVANMQLKTQVAPCWTVGDEVRIIFGADADAQLLSGAGPMCIVKNVGPVVLGGQNHSLLLHMWNPANATTPPSWECEFAWWER
jgi:hypothetical protein